MGENVAGGRRDQQGRGRKNGDGERTKKEICTYQLSDGVVTDRERAANTKKVGGTVARLVVALTGLGVSLPPGQLGS